MLKALSPASLTLDFDGSVLGTTRMAEGTVAQREAPDLASMRSPDEFFRLPLETEVLAAG